MHILLQFLKILKVYIQLFKKILISYFDYFKRKLFRSLIMTNIFVHTKVQIQLTETRCVMVDSTFLVLCNFMKSVDGLLASVNQKKSNKTKK